MTGPPYPRYSPGTAPGQSGIGEFVIGLSPLGTIAPFDPWVTVISQYPNSPILTDMILSFNAAMDQTANLDNFYDMIWNVMTAEGYGLDVWGRIVGVSRTIQLPVIPSQYFGFGEAGGSWTGFGPVAGAGGFYTGGQATSNFNLIDSDFRILVLAKAAANICDGSIPAINQILLALFPGRGECYIIDNQNMTMTYNFLFSLTVAEAAILAQSNVLPTPVGVSANVVFV